jgi:hypothetical protein
MKIHALKYKSKWVRPYNDDGTAVFSYSFLSRQAGVYLIKVDNKVQYVGSSRMNLYKTLYRHFEVWNHYAQKVISYASRYRREPEAFKIRVFILNHSNVERWENYFIVKYNAPKDNSFIPSICYHYPLNEAMAIESSITKTPEEEPF